MSTGGDGYLTRLAGKRVWVAGHTGMVGSALMRRLASEHCQLLTASHRELDLRRQEPTERWLRAQRPEIVVIAAARVGGIGANSSQPADFLYDNTMIAMNVLHAAAALGVERVLVLGSSCIYPRHAAQPITEDALLGGPLEPTNEAYAIAKIAAIKLGEAYARQYGRHFINAMPTNLYGPNDNFDPETSHVLPALLRKIVEAKQGGKTSIQIWGTGTPLREFMHADDLADACVFLLKHYHQSTPINVGSGQEVSILELAELIADIVGYTGEITCDPSRPDGTPRKRLDTSRLQAMGWTPKIELRAGIVGVYEAWLRANVAVAEAV